MARLVVVAAVLLAACKPDLGPTAQLVTRTRLVAVRAEPAEAPPGTEVAFSALVASPDGTVADADLGWSFCTAPKPLDENNTVANACLTDVNALVALGGGPTVAAPTPLDGCQRFGPAPPPQQPGDPPLRPRDPDVTGGFYQPLRVDDGAEPSFALVRIACGLANAPVDVAAAFQQRYRPNQNPALLDLHAYRDGQELALDALPAGADVVLRATWTPESAETFPLYDLGQQALVDTREALRVSWFTTGGRFAVDRSGRTGDEPDSFADNVWTTPPAGPVHLWLVLRDSRGGSAWAQYDLTIQ